MRNRSKLLVAGIAAALLLSFAVGTSSANRLSVSNRNFRIIWTPLALNPGNVRCNVTLEGSFHSATINKTVGALVGYVSRASVAAPAECTNGEATIAQESLPWHVRYRSFTGTLPRITGVSLSLINATFRVHVNSLGATCEVRTEAGRPAVGIAEVNETGTITGLRADETTRIPLAGLCGIFGTEGSFAGTGAVTLLGATTRITVRLI
jgi:hypothetical protein